ncbi:uncharacterized protein [Nicotiana sylvestris]|uniref:uncharacterized protein n=1 Tax=Nicotiana sylvestris TaxID=4096 RepID=UPI00388C7859
MITASAATPSIQPARGGGQGDRGRPKEGGHGRYYALPAHIEVVASDSIITSIVSVCHRDASVLFGQGSTYSYVSSYFAPYLGVSWDSLTSPVYVPTYVGDSLVVDRVYRSCLITLSSFETRVDLLFLSMVDFDVILGMDWLSPHYSILDCHAKTLTLSMPGLLQLDWKGYDTYLAYVRDFNIDTPAVESVPVVRDFLDVFPADLSGMPPDRDIDFFIDLLQGTQPISIPPYRMAPPELKEQL